MRWMKQLFQKKWSGHKRFAFWAIPAVILLTAGIAVSVIALSEKKDAGISDEQGIQTGTPGSAAEGAEVTGDQEKPENIKSTVAPSEESLPETDLNRNGIPEEIRIVEAEDGEGKELEVWENGELILREVGFYVHAGQKAMFLCRLDGEDYLLRYHPTMYQGCGDYDYELFTMENNEETTARWNAVSFDINFGSPVHGNFEAEEIAAFMEEVNGLLSQSIELLNTDSELLKTFEKEGMLKDTLWWLDREETGFSRDSSKSLLENLQEFQWAMEEDVGQAVEESCDALPFEQGMEMMFCSGAGAWRTYLTLYPDGDFVGEYTDSDAGSAGESYPNGTRYICRFHGHFGDIRQVSDASFSLELKELSTDTEYPVGEEWIEDGVRLVSSEPYGFDGEDGAALKPGASFLFYTPEAKGHKPGTELYGAVYFCNWMPERHAFEGETDTLGYYGLHNLETDCGFFSTEVLEADYGK